MRIFFTYIMIVFLAVFTCWSAAGAELSNRIVACVNDDVVTLYELNSRITEMTGSDPQVLKAHDRGRFEEVQKRVLDMLVEEKLTESKVKELGISVPDSEVDAAVERIKQSNGWSQEELLRNVRREGTTYEGLRDELRRGIQRNRLVNYEVKSRIIIRDESLREYYESHKDSFSTGSEVHLAGIVLPFENSGSPGDREAAVRKAEDILARLRRGETFAELAAAFSKGPGAGEGGDLGVFSLSELDEEIRDAIAGLELGKVSRPIIRPGGVQILKVLDRTDGDVREFEEVKDAIYQILYEKEMDARYVKWIEDLKKQAYIRTTL